MPQDISFTFNTPGWVLPSYVFLLLGLAIPAEKFWRLRTASQPIRGFILSRQGLPYITLILLWLFCTSWTTIQVYTKFWTLQLENSERLRLDHWFPRADLIFQPHQLDKIILETNIRRDEGDIVNQYWKIFLSTHQSVKHTSVTIHDQNKAKQAIAALERWSGRSHTHYIRDCAHKWGIQCTTTHVSADQS